MKLIDADALQDEYVRLSGRELKLIDEAQIIDAEPIRHGHWALGRELSRDYIGDICVSIHYDKCWCSKCHYPVEGLPLWKYCPNCGAKMDERGDAQ